MGWWIAAAWLTAVVLAAVILIFCAYELHWKSRRLRTDLDRLDALSGRLAALRADLAAAQRRAAETGR